MKTQPLTPRQEMINQVRLSLGAPKINVELSPEHYELALDVALERYRYRSSNAVGEYFSVLELQPDEDHYQLPDNVCEVRSILRRNTTGTAGLTAQFDPFVGSTTNQFMLQAGRAGGLLTYELFAGYQELLAKMFGGYITFTYDRNMHILRLDRHIRGREQVLLHIYAEKPDDILIKDRQARNWLRDYTIAKSKEILGTIRGKWSGYAVPGGSSMDGDALKTEAQATMERLENEVANQMDQDMGMPIFIG